TPAVSFQSSFSWSSRTYRYRAADNATARVPRYAGRDRCAAPANGAGYAPAGNQSALYCPFLRCFCNAWLTASAEPVYGASHLYRIGMMNNVITVANS